MSTTKAFILTGVILATVVFIVYGYREVKKNEKRSFGGTGRSYEEESKEYSLQEIINEIK